MQYQQAVDEFLSYLQVERNCSPHTIRAYEFDLQSLERFLTKYARSTELQSISSSTIRRYIQDEVLNHAAKPKTLQRRISSLKSFTKFCLKESWLESDFMAGIIAPKSDKKLPIYMKGQELKQFLSYLNGNTGKAALRDRCMFTLLATTGLRRQELVDLNWQDVDLQGQTILVHGKGNKERLLPLRAEFLPLLEEYRESLTPTQQYLTEPIFMNLKGQRLNPRGLHRIFKQLSQFVKFY